MTEHVINDQTQVDHLISNGGACGCLPRKTEFGASPYASAAPIDLIPWEEMPDRIADQERNESSLEHIWKDSGIGILNQNPLSYCWVFSAGMALMMERAIMGLPHVSLSPSSVGAPIVGYQNRGWYVEEALRGLINQGMASTDFVPATTTRANDFKAGWRDDAAKYKVTAWVELPPNNLQAQLTMLLLNRPLAVGLDWWGHSVCFLRALDRNPRLAANDPSRYGTKYANSWDSTWGDNGWGILEGSKQLASQSYAIEQATFTG